MPKCLSSKLPSLRKWIEPYNKSGEVFKTLNNNSVFCPFYSNLIHVTCAAHGIHRIAEKIMDIFHEINDLINNGKKIILKAPYRIQLYHEMLPNTPLPPQPIITRWGAWLESAIFYADNFENFKNVIQNLQEDGVKSIQNCKQILTKSNIINDLTNIKINFSIIVESIKKLDTSGLLLK